jgi:hypothetical protein
MQISSGGNQSLHGEPTLMQNYKRKQTPYTNKNRDRQRKKQGFKGFFMLILMMLRHPRTHYVICTFGIGDAILACGYLRAYQKRQGIRHITLVGKERMRYLYEQYGDQYDSLWTVREEDIVCITNAFLFDPACYLFMKWMRRATPVPVMFYYRNLLVNHIASVNMVNTFKAVIFGLPQDTPLTVAKPQYVPIDEYIKKYGLKRGKTAILSPAARNTPLLPDSFWEMLALRLHERGFSMIVNRFDYGRDLPYAIGLDCDLSVMLSLAEYGGHVISLRSGFCDYMSLTSCRLTAIYPENWDFTHNVSMAEWGIRSDINEIQYCEGRSHEIIEIISEKHGNLNSADPVVSKPHESGAPADRDVCDAGFWTDAGRMVLSLWGVLVMGCLLLANRRTHFVLTASSVEDIRCACALGAAFGKSHDIGHLTVILPGRYRMIAREYAGWNGTVCVGGFTYSCLLHAFRFDFAYFRFYEWGRRVTVADAEVFFRRGYAEFRKLAGTRELYETALMPVRGE